jgi:hypothetical protein
MYRFAAPDALGCAAQKRHRKEEFGKWLETSHSKLFETISERRHLSAGRLKLSIAVVKRY